MDNANGKFTKAQRNAVCDASNGLPTLNQWLNRIVAIGDRRLTVAVDGIWCGREGREALEVEGTSRMLVVGWYNGRVEYSYLS